MPFEAGPQARAPRMRILVNGTPLRGGVEAEVVNNNHREADTFSALVALGHDPGFDARFWGREKQVVVGVEFGFEPPGGGPVPWQPVFAGVADHVQLNLVEGSVSLSGRDLSSRLIDAKTREVFPNQTSSEIVMTLAARHGLKADVTPTKTPVGQYYKEQHDRITLDSSARTQNEWELLRDLATQEGYDLWVNGEILHFHPYVEPDKADPFVCLWRSRGVETAYPSANVDNLVLERSHPYVEPDKADPFVCLWRSRGVETAYPSANVDNLVLERSLSLAKDLRVVVKTWSARNAASAEYKAGSTTKGAQEYVKVKPGLTPAQAQALANQLLREIAQHERVISFNMPGELRMVARTIIRLQGTGSDWDEQPYYVDSITRKISVDNGFAQSVRAKNTSPRAESARAGV